MIVAVNVIPVVFPAGMGAGGFGEIVIESGKAVMLMVAVPGVPPCSEVAVNVTVGGLGIVCGAVYVVGLVVVDVNVPQASPVQPVPDRAQVTF
jgi:hypothetical protein